jgi:hypothetical protein
MLEIRIGAQARFDMEVLQCCLGPRMLLLHAGDTGDAHELTQRFSSAVLDRNAVNKVLETQIEIVDDIEV